jgi:hypothetical protein
VEIFKLQERYTSVLESSVLVETPGQSDYVRTTRKRVDSSGALVREGGLR